jgi:hypothetical protein
MSREERQRQHGYQPTLEESKVDLLAWGIQTDDEIRAHIAGMVEQAKGTVRAAAPWMAGAALVGGLLFGRGRKRKGRDGEESRGGMFSVGNVLKFAIKAAPFVIQFLRARREHRR